MPPTEQQKKELVKLINRSTAEATLWFVIGTDGGAHALAVSKSGKKQCLDPLNELAAGTVAPINSGHLFKVID